MNWLTLITLLIKLVLEIVNYLERRQLIAQVQAEQLKVLMERANEVANDAQLARKSTPTDDDSLLLDPDNRANWPKSIDHDTDTDRSST